MLKGRAPCPPCGQILSTFSMGPDVPRYEHGWLPPSLAVDPRFIVEPQEMLQKRVRGPWWTMR